MFQSCAATCKLCAPQLQVPLSPKHSVLIIFCFDWKAETVSRMWCALSNSASVGVLVYCVAFCRWFSSFSLTCNHVATVLTSVLTIFVLRESDSCFIVYVWYSIVLLQNQINESHITGFYSTVATYVHTQSVITNMSLWFLA